MPEADYVQENSCLLVHIKNIKVSCNPLGLFFRVVSGYMKLKYTFKTDQLSFFSRGGHIL